MNAVVAAVTRSHEYLVEVIPPEELKKLDEIIERYSGDPTYLVPALKDAQEMFGYLPREVQQRLARGMRISTSDVYGVVTFYSLFSLEPRGRHTIRLCLGTACYVKGAQEILDTAEKELGLKVGETSPDRRFSLHALRCLGACGLAPVMVVGEDTHANMETKRMLEILGRYG